MEYIDLLKKKLSQYHRRKLMVSAARGLQLFSTGTAGYFLLLVFSEYLLHGSVLTRGIMFFSWLAVAAGTAFWYVFRPVIQTFFPLQPDDYLKLAQNIGSEVPAIADRLLNILQLHISPRGKLEPTVFSQAALHQVYALCVPYDFEKIVKTGNLTKLTRIALGTGIVAMMLTVFIPPLHEAAGRLFLFNKTFLPPAKYHLVIAPGNIRASKGSDVELTVIVHGGIPKSMQLLTKDKEQGSWSPISILPDSLNEYHTTLKNLRSDVEYYATVEGVESERYKLTIFDHPVLKELNVKITPPTYSGIPETILKDNGSFQCLSGSAVQFEITSTKILSKAQLIINDSLKQSLTVIDNLAIGQLRVKQDIRYRIEITDFENVKNEDPVLYTVKVTPDLFPFLTVLEPEQNSVLPGNQRLDLALKIQDDYGFTSVKLHYRLSSSRYEQPQKEYSVIAIPFNKAEKDQSINYIWNLSQLSLATEDVISFYLEIADNDNIGGPKTVRSEEFSTRVPSLQEILKKSDVVQDKQQNELKQALKEANELKQEIENLSKDLKKDKKDLSYDEKERIKQAAEKFENLQKKMEQSREEMKKNTEELQQNNLLSKETLQKYMELQEMMKEMSSEEMKKAMEKMQQQLQNLDRKQLQQQLQNMKFDEEMFQKSIERTLNLLKRVQIEQKVDELIKRTEQLEQEQNKLAEEAAKQNSPQEQKQLKEQQKEIGKKLDELNKEMKDLADKMKNFKDLPNEQMEQVQKEFEEQNNDELSDEAEQAMQKQNKPQAQQKQSQIAKNMQKMKKDMQNLQSAMMQQQQMKTFQDMARLLNDILQHSKDEEALKDHSLQGEREMSYSENARKQDGLKRNLDNTIQNMGKIAQKSFAITPEMGKELGKARQKMDQAISSLQSKNGSPAASQQTEAMKALNEAASLLKDNMADMMQQGGSQGGGMMSMMQQMGKLSGQQMQLNNQSQQLMQGNGGQMSQQQMGEMQRLAQQQELIKKSLDQMAKEARSTGQSKKLPGNMNEISKQMDEVISDMRTQKDNDDFLQKQERILSKLLDIQRSLNERDYEKERESFTGTNSNRNSPADIKAQQKKNNKLQDELNRMQQDGYIRDYEELIRKYLEKLQKEQAK